MTANETFTFSIDRYTPETLPMARLAEYLSHLATLYGCHDNVHFDNIKKGSTLVQVLVEEPAVATVLGRLHSMQTGNFEPDVQKAYHALDLLLKKDGAVGSISHPTLGKLLDFSADASPPPESYVVTQPTTMDGVVIKIGGRDESIPVTLRNSEGKIIHCQVRGAAHAKELSRHYLDNPIRVHGTGKWVRHPGGTWEMELLVIQSFEELDTTPADEVLAGIKRIGGNGWRLMENPLEEWREMRGLK